MRALARLGHEVRVESGHRAERPNPAAAGIQGTYLSDDGPRRQLLDAVWLAARHPVRCLADIRRRRRWKSEEPVRSLRALAPAARRAARSGDEHLHAHFAAGAALDALRLSRLLSLPYSVTAHGYDIYLEPRNLREKLERAAAATSGCEYTVRDLRSVAPSANVHEVIMGVDGGEFARSRPHGRLVEKKGFAHLIEAAGILRASEPLERVTIVGDGPLRAELAAQIRDRALEQTVTLTGALPPSAVRELLEDSDLLAMPCVIAADGDRDSMPVVVKEALAMEVPVVASDEVGLPELVRPEFGRLVPPGDAEALAAGVAELLALDPAERAAMGRAGRAHVLETCDVMRETARLVELIESARR